MPVEEKEFKEHLMASEFWSDIAVEGKVAKAPPQYNTLGEFVARLLGGATCNGS